MRWAARINTFRSAANRGGDPIEDETEIKRITDDLRGAGQASGYPRGQDNEPKASPGPEDEGEFFGTGKEGGGDVRLRS